MLNRPSEDEVGLDVYAEDELLPLSALQHLIFCERQCALIHVERLWEENRLTVEGKHLHERADSQTHTTAGNVRIVRSLPIRSLELGIVGQADVVEFRDHQAIPVEYKRGKPKKDDSDRVQLCAQTLCLEEMLGQSIREGALFYGQRKRRTQVLFDQALKTLTLQTIDRLREMINTRQTPPAVYDAKCKACSLLHLCLPSATTSSRSASRFMSRQIRKHQDSEDGPSTDDL